METGSRLAFSIHLLFWLMVGVIGYSLAKYSAKGFSTGIKRALIILAVMPTIFLPTLTNLIGLVIVLLVLQIYRSLSSNYKSALLQISVLSVLVTMAISSFNVVRHELLKLNKREIRAVFNCGLLNIHVTSQIENIGDKAYEDQIAYYQGIANEMRLKYLPESRIDSSLSCKIFPKLNNSKISSSLHQYQDRR